MSELSREDIECRKLARQKQNENGGISIYARSENDFQIALCDMALAHLASGEAADMMAAVLKASVERSDHLQSLGHLRDESMVPLYNGAVAALEAYDKAKEGKP